MGSMWMDPRGEVQFPVQGDAPVPDFDEKKMVLRNLSFPRGRWGADFKAMIVLHQFVDKYPHWFDTVKINPPPKATDKQTKDELRALVKFQQPPADGGPSERTKRLSEILAQDIDFQSYFVAQMGISKTSHPDTYLVLKMAARLGEMVMVVQKSSHNRARPSSLYPLLFPPVPVAEHAAYPSGHSLIGHLMALAIMEIVPQMGRAPLDLAFRIAENREAAGLHFSSDTAAGQEAAFQLFKMLKDVPLFDGTMKKANNEWG